MTSQFRQYVILSLLCGIACAQETGVAPLPSKLDEYMETGMELAGVRAPYYDEEGHLQAQLYGGHARIMEGGVADVADLRIDVYQDDAVSVTLYAPQCFTRVIEKDRKKVLSVYSDGDVLIEMKELTITGRGFRFTSEGNRFEILNDSRVLVKEAARDRNGVEL